ncbi:MAG TPA: GGDEF domain-containing protein [Gallionella sp.]|nr:GGDEF domain-containing protein [Gallionella sp.]
MKKYFRNIDEVLRRRSPNEIRETAFLMIVIISVADYFAGYEISTSLFFLVPIALATWYGTSRLGVYYSFLSTSIWFLVDTVVSGHTYAHPLIPYWNSGVRLGLFLVATQFLTLLKSQSHIEQNLSRTDGLTGVMNGRGFAEAAERMFELAARHGRPTTLAYIDLDDFKQVNDRQGHSEGDKVLQTVGEVLLESMRKTDLASRLGGDEFAIALPETNETGAQAFFSKVRGNLALAMKKNNWPVGFSIGVISFDLPPADFDDAVRLAAALMYQAKKNGKNNILFAHYPPDKKFSAEPGES